jgi:hypothetical protein
MSGTWRLYCLVGICPNGSRVVICGSMNWDEAIRAREAVHETCQFLRVLVELEALGDIAA